MELDRAIGEAEKSITQNESKKREVVRGIKERAARPGFGAPEFIEGFFKRREEPAVLDGRITGTDAGFVSKELFALDLILVRAVGACFSYKAGKLERAQYYPGAYAFPEPYLNTEFLERDEFNVLVSIRRLLHEANAAMECIERFGPTYAFWDGSIIPQQSDRPRASSAAHKHYVEMVDRFAKLYALAEEKRCTLVATVEDSRSDRWRQIVRAHWSDAPEYLKNYSDAAILEGILERGERTSAFSYSTDLERHVILQDMEEKWAKNTHAFYIRPSAFDFPLRVEFMCERERVSEVAPRIAKTVLAQASGHREYAYPSVLIEADLRSRLKSEEISLVTDRIVDKIGKNAFMLRRRDRRPF